jgi:hypothetical protein
VFEHTPEGTVLSKSVGITDESGYVLSIRGTGRETGVVVLIALETQGTQTCARILSRHVQSFRRKNGAITRYLLTDVRVATPEDGNWASKVAPRAAYLGLKRWSSLPSAAGLPVDPPLPHDLNAAARVSHPYEYPSKRLMAEWLKAEHLKVPADPSLGSTFSHYAEFRPLN